MHVYKSTTIQFILKLSMVIFTHSYTFIIPLSTFLPCSKQDWLTHRTEGTTSRYSFSMFQLFSSFSLDQTRNIDSFLQRGRVHSAGKPMKSFFTARTWILLVCTLSQSFTFQWMKNMRQYKKVNKNEVLLIYLFCNKYRCFYLKNKY